MSKSPFRKGTKVIGDRDSGSNQKFVSISPDSKVYIVPTVGLDEMISVEQWEFWNVRPAVILPNIPDSPCKGIEPDKKPKFKAFLPVLYTDEKRKTSNTAEMELGIYAFGIGVARELMEMAEDVDIKGALLVVKREGASLKTRYTLINTGKRVDVKGVEEVDIISRLGPVTVEEQLMILNERGLLDGAAPTKASDFEDDDEDYEEVAADDFSEDEEWNDI